MKDTTIVQHKNIDQILFPVERLKIQKVFPGFDFADNITHCIYLPKQNKVVHTCTKVYELVNNEYLIVPIYRRMLKIFGEKGFEARITSYDDRKFYCQFIIHSQLFEIIRGDGISPVIEINNSYDGSIKQHIALGFFRQICSNGLMAFKSAFKLDLKHSSNVGKIDLQPVFNKLDHMDIKLNRFKKLTERRVLPDEMASILQTIRKSASIKYPRKLIRSAPLIAEKEAAQLGAPLSAWLIYNGFNNALYHSDGKLLPEERERIDGRVLKVIEKELSIG